MNPATVPHYSALAPFLSSHEKVIWAGNPQQGLWFRAKDLAVLPFAILWGMAVLGRLIGIFAIGAWNSQSPLFEILFFVVGFYAVSGMCM